MWSVVQHKSTFRERTIRFNATKMEEIRSTCTHNQVSGLSNGRWRTNDPKSRKNQVHTLDLARAGEIAAYTILRMTLARQHPEWTVGEPDFSPRKKGQHDCGDIPIDTGDEILWVEVKTTTNRRGAHNKKNVNAVARSLGYTFQKMIFSKWKNKMVLTPTFNAKSPYHEKAKKRLLIGCIGTYTKNGGCSITVSKGTFMLPVAQCTWERLNHYAEGEEDLKMVHKDMQCI